MINGIGYVGAILSGYVTGYMADQLGWGAVFLMLSAFAVITIIASIIFWILDIRDIKAVEDTQEETSLLIA